MAVDLDFFRSETSQRLRAEGRVEGRAEGRAQGEAHGRARAILLLLSQRKVTVPDSAQEQITDCQDLTVLDTWFTRAITATTVEEIFKED